ncbi:riboflavin biosynthesis protein RibF [Sporosarcina sp. P37]|uniref:riboflavin biosynthesis protein RibF n=1 Tax=unclassified Sporosarcina TaxID=2647733 RepID=UPI0009C064A5|nr:MULTISPECIES: riboflavin biosynthesis protein RibF [unclassified Sporosarcina]ARD49338.1 bifunctional riboflavin kinase/FMN adenylyltransferase [Sporosarcina sp. P33]ARK25811.1 riboflavin biosynthesis protein RibF [Sporosarcina sp. P37]PID19165.1 riboflavin biosynthesis protein RibF [Sporosarcina sp. P35]
MEIFRLRYPDQVDIGKQQAYSLAIGFFDGVHKGHQEVICSAKKTGDELGLQTAVMTFDPHPSQLFSGKNVGYITPLDEKVRVLDSLGIDALFIVSFDWELAGLSPERFIEIFIKGLGVQHVTAGFDFTFGSKGSGKMKDMQELSGNMYGTTVIPKVTFAEERKVSSTEIRRLLSDGNVEAAAELLGRPFRTLGEVVHGEKRGRQLGFPTANIQTAEEHVVPANGVYAVRCLIGDTWYPGVCNMGVKPTFHDPEHRIPTAEVHLIGEEMDLYGQRIAIEWLHRIRAEKKFDSLEALKTQIGIDKQTAKDLLTD